MQFKKWSLVLARFCCCAAVAAAQPGPLKAGASRIDITPPKDASLLMSGYGHRQGGHTGIHDPLWVRALVLDNGHARAAILSADLIGFSHDFWRQMVERIHRETGIPADFILLTATHTHGAPAIEPHSLRWSRKEQGEYANRVREAIAGAVRDAQARLSPARIGFGEGRANVNMNRVARWSDGSWFLGLNPDGPSDKTVAALKLEGGGGRPIAVLFNYAMHGTGMGQENTLITGDTPGAAARYVEQGLGAGAVALFTSGAAGDQAPLYDLSPKSFAGVGHVGALLGEEVLRVVASIRTSGEASISARQKALTCPGRKLTPGPRVRAGYEWVDADPVLIRLSMLRINDIVLGGVSGEALHGIGQRWKRECPAPHAVMITHANGSSGYLPDEASYAIPGYEIQTARVKPGCAEEAIVRGLSELAANR